MSEGAALPAEVVERARAAQASLRPLLARLQAVPFPVVGDGPEPQAGWRWVARGGGPKDSSGDS